MEPRLTINPLRDTAIFLLVSTWSELIRTGCKMLETWDDFKLLQHVNVLVKTSSNIYNTHQKLGSAVPETSDKFHRSAVTVPVDSERLHATAAKCGLQWFQFIFCLEWTHTFSEFFVHQICKSHLQTIYLPSYALREKILGVRLTVQ